jgi:hypothetical protein
MSRFVYDKYTNSYIKRIVIDDDDYDLSIPKDQWSNNVRQKFNYLILEENVLEKENEE